MRESAKITQSKAREDNDSGAKDREGDSEFMAKLSELTGKLSNMDYVPKNKLLKKEYEKSEYKELDEQIK